ncbi:hypothetical protein PPTG_20893 [Phytophthora nicotianae INRA-310]|uniref:Uncharacterized protein n=1 Tax=Phytophthora nicotianae (strain INRA-310) TaxID=761204 RepID=W2RBW5_PHYN3|nr:hypothetical protein PPTG_20893 [Phytophthora nicotianae INRA-310]ETN22179.1 hypothetical protein PPTG_20893 [Phytophthora nicotianae INRA-310]
MREFKGLCRNYYVNYQPVNDFAQGAPARRIVSYGSRDAE